jgi:hypothetical protein
MACSKGTSTVFRDAFENIYEDPDAGSHTCGLIKKVYDLSPFSTEEYLLIMARGRYRFGGPRWLP